ncbi:MAG: LrgB family protein [Mangrovibacterium sp.]
MITNNPLFGFFLCALLYYIAIWIRNKMNWGWFNPLLFSATIIIAFLLLADIPYVEFKQGADIINLFLGPVTVILALPLYRQRKLLVKYRVAILGGILSGVLTSFLTVLGFSKLLGLSDVLYRSLIPHSVTTPIGISTSEMLDASVGVSIISVVITGVLGAAIAPLIMKLLKITSAVARGVAIGTSSHALGTAKAIEMGETEGAMSGLAIGLSALTTILLVIVLQFLEWC